MLDAGMQDLWVQVFWNMMLSLGAWFLTLKECSALNFKGQAVKEE
jgi:hypothetical protein